MSTSDYLSRPCLALEYCTMYCPVLSRKAYCFSQLSGWKKPASGNSASFVFVCFCSSGGTLCLAFTFSCSSRASPCLLFTPSCCSWAWFGSSSCNSYTKFVLAYPRFFCNACSCPKLDKKVTWEKSSCLQSYGDMSWRPAFQSDKTNPRPKKNLTFLAHMLERA